MPNVEAQLSDTFWFSERFSFIPANKEQNLDYCFVLRWGNFLMISVSLHFGMVLVNHLVP